MFVSTYNQKNLLNNYLKKTLKFNQFVIIDLRKNVSNFFIV